VRFPVLSSFSFAAPVPFYLYLYLSQPGVTKVPCHFLRHTTPAFTSRLTRAGGNTGILPSYALIEEYSVIRSGRPRSITSIPSVQCHQPEIFAPSGAEELSQQQANELIVKAINGCLTRRH
jgi:hypothetical protein